MVRTHFHLSSRLGSACVAAAKAFAVAAIAFLALAATPFVHALEAVRADAVPVEVRIAADALKHATAQASALAHVAERQNFHDLGERQLT